MKMVIVALCALVAVTIAAPTVDSPPVEVVVSSIEQKPDGSYDRKLQLSNGVETQETGELKEVLNEENKTVKVIIVRGSYTVPNAEGSSDTITYVADENGYKADGNTIPKGPEVQRR